MSRPPLPDAPHAGQCLCGQVRFRLSARPLALNACHCNDCKALSGADYIKMMIGERAAFSADGETARWRKRADSGREIDIVRCAQCGVRLWHEPLSSPHLVFIAVGALDNANAYEPASHIWIEKASPQVAMAEDAARIVGQPKERQELFEAFDRVYPR